MRYVDLFRFWAREHPDKEFASDGTRTVTYGDADDTALRVAAALRRDGLGCDDRVAILATNSIEYAVFYLGCALAGCVPTPLNFRLVGAELAYIINNAEASLIIADEQFTAVIDDIRNDVPRLNRFIAISATPPTGWSRFETWYGDAPADAASLPSVPGTTSVLQVYTSGTTGRPKGVMMSHDAISWYALQQGAALASLGVLDGRLLVVSPMFHAGISMLWFTAVSYGGSLYIQERFVPGPTVDALRNENIAWTLLIPAMIQSCLVDVPDVSAKPFDDLRLITYGGSSIAEGVVREAMHVFGCEFVQLYGLTETNAVVNLSPDDHRRALESRPELLTAAGRPLPGCAVRIVDTDGNDLPPGENGEIVVRGPQLLTGYWRNDDATAAAIRHSWFWTGDAGTIDDEGYLYVRDRLKDMVVTGGENVYPREVETVLFDHPGVADAAVIGVPDPRWGEAVKAVVVPREQTSLDPDDVIAFCRARLAAFKCPKSVDIVDELPRNPSGKVLKTQLREPYWHGQSRRV